MTAPAPRRLKKIWHVLRRRQKRHAPRPSRLIVTKERWLGGAHSPVVLMIDDLTNAWHNSRGGTSWEPGGDWGAGLDAPGGAVDFLEKELLAEFPEARTTFFVVGSAISPYTSHQPFSYAAPLDADEKSIRFFTKLSNDPRYELAYHGFNHGTPGASSDTFLQEWRGFPSQSAAEEQTRRGLEIFRRAIGRAPQGGKYGGWAYNEFSEGAINNCGFMWWCRDWTPRDVTGSVDDAYYEPQFFGEKLVVSLPSAVHGQFWDTRQVDILLARRQMIGIEEHISGVRPDGLVQTPNIVDDIHELRALYRYLRGKNVWHANCSDIAAYVIAREGTLIHDVTADGFSVRYSGRAERPVLTLRIDGSAICDPGRPHVAIEDPQGQPLPQQAYRFDARTYAHLITFPVANGRYRVRPSAAR